MMTSPRSPLPTIPPPLHEPRNPAGTTDARGKAGPCCRRGAELLRLGDGPGDARGTDTFELVLAIVTLLAGVLTIALFTLT